MIRMWNYGMMGKGRSVWRVVWINTAITALVIYGVAAESWIAGGIGIAWVVFNTVGSSISAARDAPLFQGAMTKIEAELERCSPDPESAPSQDAV